MDSLNEPDAGRTKTLKGSASETPDESMLLRILKEQGHLKIPDVRPYARKKLAQKTTNKMNNRDLGKAIFLKLKPREESVLNKSCSSATVLI